MHCIGLDVHTAMTTVCVMDPNGKIVREKVIRGPLQDVVSAVAALQKELGAVRICYEASTSAGWLWDRLQGAGRTILAAHPGKVRMIFRAKRKNDRIDARKLAFLTFVDQVPLAHIPSAARREWRGVIEYRRRLVDKRGGIKSRLRAILRSQAIQAPRGLWSKKGVEWLSKVELGMGPSLQRDLLLLELQQVRETTAHHLLRVMLAMLRSGECWRAPAPASRANEIGKQEVALEPKAA